MRIAVIYGSRLGATRGIAERIAARLGASGLDVQIAAAERPTSFSLSARWLQILLKTST